MNFAIVEEISPEILDRLKSITRISEYLNQEFSKKDYGDGVRKIIVGINCVNPKLFGSSRDFETGELIFKKYSKAQRFLDFTVKLNYKEVQNATDTAVIDILEAALLKSYSDIENLNIKDFNIGDFYSDLRDLMQERSWLNQPYREKIFNYQQPQKHRTKFLQDEKMPVDAFWELIEKSRVESQNDFNRQIEVITDKLSKKGEQDIIGFECTLREMLMRANHYNVMAVQKIIEGSVHDDSFLYFRCKLILYGRITFENAINNPNYIFERIDPLVSGEPLLTVADTAFKVKFGEHTDKDLPRDYASKVIDYDLNNDPVKGNDWEERELIKRYSKLWKAYR